MSSPARLVSILSGVRPSLPQKSPAGAYAELGTLYRKAETVRAADWLPGDLP